MSRMIRQLYASHFHNQLTKPSPRLFTSLFSSSPSPNPSQESELSSNPQRHLLSLTPKCIQRLKQLNLKRAQTIPHNNRSHSLFVALRVSVEGGGCSGFQYKFQLEDIPDKAIDSTLNNNTDDYVLEQDGVRVLIDKVSLPWLTGASIDYEEELMRSAFTILQNPNSESGCSCGTSFAPKM
mmetsp:Transcript_9677/g.17435  ORF Transcript_9677/g.17435 Transcript_9677/m.17435 type:complete len:181 (+) Transcript_9677:88-630(+)